MRKVGSLLLSLAALCAAPPANAQEVKEKLDTESDAEAAASAFHNTRWSMVFPEVDFEGGCTQGFFTFRFSPTGYFVFDNTLQGSWRVDPARNIQLKSRQGQKFTLRIREDNQLELLEGMRVSNASYVWRVRRNARFQKCTGE